MHGIGTDIIEIERIRRSIDKHGQHFLDRQFTIKEQEYCLKYKDSAIHFAGRFAAKEAIAKALGTGFGKELTWHDLEILADEMGKPIVHLSERVSHHFKNPRILLSISHCQSHATAFAVWD